MLKWVEQSESGTNATSKKVDFSYNDDGSLNHLNRYTGTSFDEFKGSSHYGYDNLTRLTDLVHKNSLAADLVDYDWLYDAAGRITDLNADYPGPSGNNIDSNVDYEFNN